MPTSIPTIRAMTPDLAEYLRDESRIRGSAASISFPRSEAELVQLLREQCGRGVPVTVQGARTGLTAAAVPQGGHILNLSRMDAVTGMRVDNAGRFYLRVQPGVILSRLCKMLEDRRFDTHGWDDASLRALAALQDAPEQFFPPDPTESSATIGGMAACNASGAKSYRYGAMRRHVTALRVALYDGDTLTLRRGECTATGRRLALTTDGGRRLDLALPAYQMPATKNAAGYYIRDNMDAVDLFIGSDGTLGVLFALELALLPQPAAIWGATCFFPGEEEALDFVVALRGGENIAAIEYFDENALAILREQKAGNAAFARLPAIPVAHRCAVYLELHCASEETAAACLSTAGDAMVRAGGREADSWVARTAFDRETLSFFRHAAPESVNMRIDAIRRTEPAVAKLGTDMAVPDDRLREVMALYRRDLAAAGLQYAIWGHIGDNHLHVNILPRNIAEMRAGKALYQRWAEAVTAMGGSVSAEHGVGKLKAPFLAAMYGTEHIAAMAALKRVFDPAGLLGAGNLFAPERGRPCE